MSKMHLEQPGFTWVYGLFIKTKERIKKFEINRRFKIYLLKKLDNDGFQNDTTYGNFKDLPRKTVSDKLLRDKAFNVAKNLKYDGYHINFNWFKDFFIKILLGLIFLFVLLKIKFNQTSVLLT